MRAKIIGAVSGALIVSLALTAGRQYAQAQSIGKAWTACVASDNANSELLRSAQQTNWQLLQVIEQQKAQLQALRATGLQLHELPSGKIIAIMPQHNELGGYTAACGSLPGVLGDDC